MLVYKCILTECELFSDSYPQELVDDLYYKVTGKLVSESGGIDESKIGANASAEDAGEGLEEGTKTGVNIVLYSRLMEIGVDRKSYLTIFKEYANNLVKYYQKEQPDKVDALKSRLLTFRKTISELWKKEDFQAFEGEGSNSEGMLALLGYDDNTPYMIFFKDGLLEEKC